MRVTAAVGKVTDRTNQADSEEEKRHRSRGYVIVDDAENVALHRVIGRNVDCLVVSLHHQQDGDDGEEGEQDFFHTYSWVSKFSLRRN